MFLTEDDRNAIRDSWRLVVPIKDTVPELFYRRLFELQPSYRALFKGEMPAQRRKLMAMLGFIVKALDWPDHTWQDDVEATDDLFLVVLALGRRHSELYQVPHDSYAVVREALMFALDYGLGEAFTAQTRASWERMYDAVALTMRMGTGAKDIGTPVVAPPEEEG